MNLRLHKEHGVNPTIPQCFICGEDKNEIVLLGNAYKDKAPMKMCIDKEPCDKCKGYMKQGIILISVRDGEEEKNTDNPYRTGNFCVIKEEALKDVLSVEVLKRRICFIPDSVWEKLGLPTGK